MLKMNTVWERIKALVTFLVMVFGDPFISGRELSLDHAKSFPGRLEHVYEIHPTVPIHVTDVVHYRLAFIVKENLAKENRVTQVDGAVLVAIASQEDGDPFT